MTLTTIDIYKLLPKTNCKECRANSCFAFAALVFKGDREIDECPYVDKTQTGLLKGSKKRVASTDSDQDNLLNSLRKKVSELNLESRAIPTGGIFSNNRLTVKVMGKDFTMDSTGKFFTDIHINPWIAFPFMDYVLNSRGVKPTGTWVPFRELSGGKDRYRLFEQRCEKPLKKLADTFPNLFQDIMELFNGKEVENHYKSDISLVLHPFPLMPMLICYWKPDGKMESELNLFFDITAEENLNIHEISTLATGIVTMFEKIVLKHGITSA